MTTERTELEWPYRPEDFFEAPYHERTKEYQIVVDGGRVLATLSTPQDPVPVELRDRLQLEIETLFQLRQLQVHRKYELEGQRIYQHHPGGRRSVAISVGGNIMVGAIGQADALVRDAAGKIIRDTKAERIADHTRFLDANLPKVSGSPVLRSMLASYHAATNDPENELVHLYEIRDALANHYGGEQAAREHLGISKGEWQRLGLLANVEPLKEGRHRGKHHSHRRPASPSELAEARAIVRQWISTFANMT